MKALKSLHCLSLVFLVWSLALPALAGEKGPGHRAGQVKAMTQNLYVGADLFRILEATTADEIPLKVAETLGVIQSTNFYERAEAIADEVAEKRPDMIGLQEVSLIRVQSPGDYFYGNPQNAETVLYDYLQILMDALARHGLHYRVASVVDNADVEMPAFAGLDGRGNPQFDDVRLSDRDVILARKNIRTDNPLSANYQVNLQIAVAGVNIPFTRGYTMVDADVRGKRYRFVNTHLEVYGEGAINAIQALQAQELIGILSSESLPVVLVGDFNSSPVDPVDPLTGAVPPYAQLTWAGFLDAWVMDGTTDPGFTCCQDEDLRNPASALSMRIDHILFRSDLNLLPVTPAFRVDAETVGDEEDDRTPSGLWPSDHAGVFARLTFPVGHKGHSKQNKVKH